MLKFKFKNITFNLINKYNTFNYNGEYITEVDFNGNNLKIDYRILREYVNLNHTQNINVYNDNGFWLCHDIIHMLYHESNKITYQKELFALHKGYQLYRKHFKKQITKSFIENLNDMFIGEYEYLPLFPKHKKFNSNLEFV